MLKTRPPRTVMAQPCQVMGVQRKPWRLRRNQGPTLMGALLRRDPSPRAFAKSNSGDRLSQGERSRLELDSLNARALLLALGVLGFAFRSPPPRRFGAFAGRALVRAFVGPK